MTIVVVFIYFFSMLFLVYKNVHEILYFIAYTINIIWTGDKTNTIRQILATVFLLTLNTATETDY